MKVEQQQRLMSSSPTMNNAAATPSTNAVPVCEGFLEKKKSDHRRIPIGPSWKRRYCTLSSDGLRMFASKAASRGGEELRIIPMCHIRAVRQLDNNAASLASSPNHEPVYFDVETERGEVTSFRFRDKTAWPALIQIELIRYKNKQDVARYKRMYNNNNRTAAAANLYTSMKSGGRCNCCHHLQHSTHRNSAQHQWSPIKASQGLRTVVLPNQRQGTMGIGITVVPVDDGRVLVNRLLTNGPAQRHGEVQPGDEIVSCNGKLVTSVAMLSAHLRKSSSIRLVLKTTDLSFKRPLIEEDRNVIGGGGSASEFGSSDALFAGLDSFNFNSNNNNNDYVNYGSGQVRPISQEVVLSATAPPSPSSSSLSSSSC